MGRLRNLRPRFGVWKMIRRCDSGRVAACRVERALDLDAIRRSGCDRVSRVGIIGLVIVVEKRDRQAPLSCSQLLAELCTPASCPATAVTSNRLSSLPSMRTAMRTGSGPACSPKLECGARYSPLAGSWWLTAISPSDVSMRPSSSAGEPPLRVELLAVPGDDRPPRLGPGDDRLLADRLGGLQVFFHQDRREAEHVADVVEAVADIVGREVVGRMEVDPDQVADRIVVFGAVEPADRDASRVEGPAAIRGGRRHP